MDSVNLMLGRGASIAQVARDLSVNQTQSVQTDTKRSGSNQPSPNNVGLPDKLTLHTVAHSLPGSPTPTQGELDASQAGS